MGKRQTEEDFWARVVRRPSGCWSWDGPLSAERKGTRRGLAVLDGERLSARQVAWCLTHGELPGARLLPTCGDLGCINPAHVRPGLQLRDVPAILAAYEGGETQGSIARRYGCTRPVICRLIAVHRAREVMA